MSCAVRFLLRMIQKTDSTTHQTFGEITNPRHLSKICFLACVLLRSSTAQHSQISMIWLLRMKNLSRSELIGETHQTNESSINLRVRAPLGAQKGIALVQQCTPGEVFLGVLYKGASAEGFTNRLVYQTIVRIVIFSSYVCFIQMLTTFHT